MKKICTECGKEFEIDFSRHGITRRICSKECKRMRNIRQCNESYRRRRQALAKCNKEDEND